MLFRLRIAKASALGFLLTAGAFAQNWGVGASVGLVNDVEKRFALEEFDPKDVNAWVDFELDERVFLRGTLGSLRVNGDNSGRSVSVAPGAPPAPLPELPTRIRYATVGFSYEFWEGDYTSGVFGGLGGYKVEPEAVTPALERFRDKREEVFGWHLGVDGSFRVVSRFSILGRVTYHKIRSESRRSLLTANAGIAYRF